MKKVFGLLVCSAIFLACNESKPAEEVQVKAETTTSAAKDYELGDDKFVELAKVSAAALETGDIDSYATTLADNAVFHWNNFDSLVGKAAITDYWKKRRADVLASLTNSSQIYLPMKVKAPLTPGQMTGDYVLHWLVAHAKYKTGKEMRQRIHMVYHFNDSDKIDRISQYLDRAPINAAVAQ